MNQFACQNCQQTHSLMEPIWCCPCGGLLDITFKAEFNLDGIAKRPPNLWRYREAIPIPATHDIATLGEGFTPLLPITLDGRTVHIKQEQLFPTGSYKDRGAAVLLNQIKALGISEIVEDSSGNAGAAVAAYAARAGIDCHIYVPDSTSAGKLAQIEAYGSTLHKIPGSREDTATAVLEAAEQSYYASHSWNPFFFHGTKTFAYEVCEQLGWQAPDSVVVPAGNGTLLLGVAIGFDDLRQAGIIDHLPQVIAVQAANCAPLAAAFAEGAKSAKKVTNSPTQAEGIAIATPIRGHDILTAVRESNGRFITVTEEEIGRAWREIAHQGFYIEPTSAATIAGLRQWLPETEPTQTIVSLFSGHGLKSTDKISKLLDSTT